MPTPLSVSRTSLATITTNEHKIGAPTGTRIPILTLKGWRPNLLDDGSKNRVSYCCVGKLTNPAAAAHPVFALADAEYGYRSALLAARMGFEPMISRATAERIRPLY